MQQTQHREADHETTQRHHWSCEFDERVFAFDIAIIEVGRKKSRREHDNRKQWREPQPQPAREAGPLCHSVGQANAARASGQ